MVQGRRFASVARMLLALCGMALGQVNAAESNGELAIDLAVSDLSLQAAGTRPGDALRVRSVRLQPDDAEPAILSLRKVRVFSTDAKVIVNDGSRSTELQLPPAHYYSGTIAGEPSSGVFMSVREDGKVRAIITAGDGRWMVEANNKAPRRRTSPSVRQIESITATEQTPRSCDNDHAPTDAALFPQARLYQETLTSLQSELQPRAVGLDQPHTARIAIETDWEFYQLFGNASSATHYVSELIGYISTVFESEINTTLEISRIELWSSPADPWQQTSPRCGLLEFGRYWNENRSAVERTIAHFLSGKNAGGMAWVGVLCSQGFNVNHGGACPGLQPQVDRYGGAYGFTGGMSGDFDSANPSIVWDSLVVSHEIGHNFGSPHTHCYAGIGGSGSDVDGCYSGESSCYNGSSGLPGLASLLGGEPDIGAGTIMSYCHSQPGGLGNLELTFGADHPYGVRPERVPNRMREHVEAAAIFDASCLAYSDGASVLQTLISGDGSGTVVDDSGSLNCQADCSRSYSSGSTVTLTAVAAAGSSFAGWSGACSGSGICQVDVTADTQIEARFEQAGAPATGNIFANGFE